MAYALIGLSQIPFGTYLPKLCKELQLQGGTAGWEARIISALTGRDNLQATRKLRDVTAKALFFTPGSKEIPQGSDLMTKLQHFVLLCLHELNIVDKRPIAVEYRTKNELTMDEVLDRMTSARIYLPRIEDLGKNADPLWGTFVSLLPDAIRSIAFSDVERLVWRDHLRAKACEIGYKILRGLEITQAERSLFLMIAPGGERSFTKEELAAGVDYLDLRCMDNTDPSVKKTFELYEASVEHGPYSRFNKLIYTSRGQSKTYYYGPPARSLPISVGRFKYEGEFVSYQLEPVETLPWSEEETLKAIAEKEGLIGIGRIDRDPMIIPPPIIASTDPHRAPYTSLDEPDFKLSFSVNEMMRQGSFTPGDRTVPIREFDVSYNSAFAGRMLSTTTGNFPGASCLLMDKVFKNESFGSGELNDYDISDFVQLDPKLSTVLKPITGGQAVPDEGPAIVAGGLMREEIYYTLPGDKTVYIRTVNMTSHYFRRGFLMVLPPFREFMLASRDLLLAEDSVVEMFLAGKLNLNDEERAMTRDTINISHNAEKLRKFLPARNVPTVSPVIAAMARIVAW